MNEINSKYKIILASKSPRRAELLKEMGVNFTIHTKEVDESYPDNLIAEDIAMYISNKKASAFQDLNENEIIICSDTIVWSDGKALGKPKDRMQAIEMLKSLSGKKHQVISAITIKSKSKFVNNFDTTDVHFKELSLSEIEYYVDNFSPFDKAGAYGIQEWIGMIGIEKIEGSYFNVMGLPTVKLYDALGKFL